MNKGYSICLNEWATDKRIKSELGLLLIISGHTAKTGVCFASNKYLADTFGIDEATISRKIKKIEAAGYIEIEYEKRGNEITKRLIRLTKRSSDRLQKDHPTDDEKVMYNSTSNNITSNNIKEKEVFEEFRIQYKGTKRGLETEFKAFKVKHKDWKEVLPLLAKALSAQEEHRRLSISRNEFTPNRCNLSTWINQRRWEVEIGSELTDLTEEQYVSEYHNIGFAGFRQKYGKPLTLKIAMIAEQ